MASKNGKMVKVRRDAALMEISVMGFKSLRDCHTVELRPLTILAGANSSGKSSLMQPFLLMKQTVEATYDPGPLLINGPNAKFTSTEQMFSRLGRRKHVNSIEVGLRVDDGHYSAHDVTVCFRKNQQMELADMKIGSMAYHHAGLTKEQVERLVEGLELPPTDREEIVVGVIQNRCFLEFPIGARKEWTDGLGDHVSQSYLRTHKPASFFEEMLRSIIHLPGLRGNPERNYPVAAISPYFPGTFDKYAASVIAHWQLAKNQHLLDSVGRDLKQLGLTWKVSVSRIDDTQVEVHVGRLTKPSKGGAWDLVSIADVGFGMSQTLPVLVALQVARPGQIVYIEQPEIHLHPRAQLGMATVLADAAKRGVLVVAETHSSILLQGVQTLVAEGKLEPELVKLHWFQRGENGYTKIRSADLDEAGAFGDWPEDFDSVSLEAESRYLDAAEARRAGT